jgi:excisionase family DNA binding protein
MHTAPTFLPTADESKAAIPIAAAFQTARREPILLLPNGQKQSIPAPLAGVLAMAAQAMMSGYAVSITIHSGYLTTKQAADMLACSRQHVVKLIDEGKLRAERMPGGTHRRIRLRDLLEFMKAQDVRRDQWMDEMADITDEMGGYNELYEWKRKRNKK